MTKIEHTGITLRKKPRTNLRGLLMLYEKNFLKLKKIFPSFENNINMSYLLPEGNRNSKVTLKFIKDSKYTSTLLINQSEILNTNLISTRINVAIYHDLRMAEVRTFNGKYLFWMKNKYPNKNMFHKDEKFQWNKFLSEWLIFSKKEGLSDQLIKLHALL